MAHDALAKLPENFRALCEGLIIQVDDYASEEVLDDMEIDNETRSDGPVSGRRPAVPFREARPGRACRTWSGCIAFRCWFIGRSTRKRSAAVVTHVLVHEIGHHFGMSDEDMEAIEAAAG